MGRAHKVEIPLEGASGDVDENKGRRKTRLASNGLRAFGIDHKRKARMKVHQGMCMKIKESIKQGFATIGLLPLA
jgi:hypothetical protein